MYKSDLFIYLDDAQFSNEAAHNFNKIKTPQGVLRVKFPVEMKFGDPINHVRPKDELKWKEKHLKTIEMNYKKAPFFSDISGVVIKVPQWATCMGDVHTNLTGR